MKGKRCVEGFVFILFAISYSYSGWLPPVVVGPPISTPYQDYSPFVTADGKTIFFSSDRPGTIGDRDIWVSQKVGGVWQTPINLGSSINSSYEEHDPMVDETGTLLFFSSNRPSQYGGWWPWHLYFSKKENGAWQPAQDVGSPVNSSNGEECPFLFITKHDTFLYFASNGRPGGQGQWDIWVSHRTNGVWETPINLGVPINSGYLDAAPFLTKHIGDKDAYAFDSDKVRMYFTSMRPGGSGHIDLWRSLRLGGVWQPPENLGSVVNWVYRSDRPCFIDDEKDGEDAILYFADDNRPGGIGSWDIWITQYDKDAPSIMNTNEESNELILNAYPNPFVTDVFIRYLAPVNQSVSLKIYDITGRLISTLVERKGDGALHEVRWDGRDYLSHSLPNSILFVKLTSEQLSKTQRLIFLR